MKLQPLRSWEITIGVAVAHAAQAADDYGLPQTVYRTKETGGYAHTNALANLLHGEGVVLQETILPKNYFS